MANPKNHAPATCDRRGGFLCSHDDVVCRMTIDPDSPEALLAETKRYREEAVRKRDALVASKMRARPSVRRDEEIANLDELIADYDEAIDPLGGKSPARSTAS